MSSNPTGLGTIQPQTFYRYNKPEARPYTVVALDPEHGDFGPFTPGTQTLGIQEAINYVASQGGGTVYIRAGKYTGLNNIQLQSNLEIVGEGPATFLQLYGTLQNPNLGASQIFTNNPSQSLSNVTIHSLTLDGNWNYVNPVNGGSNCIAISGSSQNPISNIAFYDLVVQNSISAGISVSGGSSQNPISNIAIYGNRFYNNVNSDVNLNAVVGATVQGNVTQGLSNRLLFVTSSSSVSLVGNTCYNSPTVLTVGGGGASNDITVMGNTSYNAKNVPSYTNAVGYVIGASSASGFATANSADVTLIGNHVINSQGQGMIISSYQTTVTGNLFIGVAGTPITVIGQAQQVIAGNIIAAGNSTYGIQLQNPNNVLIEGNSIANVSIPISVTGTATNLRIGYNPGYSTEPTFPLASGTTYQNATLQSWLLLVPVTLTPTSSAAASATISVGTSPNNLAAVQTVSAPAGAAPTQQVLQAAVPSLNYYQLSLTNATTSQPIVIEHT